MWGINLATLLYVMIEYPNLPDIIPHHYGFFGEPDEWGGKWMLWIMTGVQIFISAVEHAALHKAIKDSERTGFSDMTGRDALSSMGPVVAGGIGWITFAGTYWGRLGKGFLIVFLGATAAVIIYVCVKARSNAGQIAGEAKKLEKSTCESGGYAVETGDLTFQGKIAVWMWAVLLFINGAMLVAAATEAEQGEIVFMAITLILIDIFLVPMYFRNRILLKDKEMVIFFGLFKKRIAYENIILLKETHNPLSSLAMSLDRIYIYTLSGDNVMVSVKDKKGFMQKCTGGKGCSRTTM